MLCIMILLIGVEWNDINLLIERNLCSILLFLQSNTYYQMYNEKNHFSCWNYLRLKVRKN